MRFEPVISTDLLQVAAIVALSRANAVLTARMPLRVSATAIMLASKNP
jgi:hypothetical protein